MTDIPQAAIEAIAKVADAYEWATKEGPTEEFIDSNWADATEGEKAYWLEVSRAALTAALPLLTAWRPIEMAPTDKEFYAFNKAGDLIRVRRFDGWPGAGNAVIDESSGRWWRPRQFLPLDAIPLPAPPETEK